MSGVRFNLKTAALFRFFSFIIFNIFIIFYRETSVLSVCFVALLSARSACACISYSGAMVRRLQR